MRPGGGGDRSRRTGGKGGSEARPEAEFFAPQHSTRSSPPRGKSFCHKASLL